MIDFKAELKKRGLKQTDFIRIVNHLSGGSLSTTTTYRWGKSATPPALAVAFIKLLQRLPEEDLRGLAAEAKKALKNG